MNKNIYYISIKSTSLAHYIAKALILPSKFYNKRPSDIQTIKSDYIILSKKKFLNNSNCSIEIILNNKELETLEKQESGIFLYSKPIPISRIKKIYFDDKIQSLKTIDTINRGVGLISKDFVEIINYKENNKQISLQIDNVYQYDKELENRIKIYNHTLGGLAFVRCTTNGDDSENYLSILHYFNNFIVEEEKNNILKINTNYNDVFKKKEEEIEKGWWKNLYPFLYKEIMDIDVEQYAEREKIFIKKSNGIFKYELLNNTGSITYILAILSIYGNGSTKSKKIEDLIYAFKQNKIERIEGVSLIFGINSGYSAFYNIYNKKKVKFEMNRDDYYTIESVFQYVINNKKDNRQFDYIDKIFINENIINLDLIPKIEKPTQDKSKDSELEELKKEFQKFKNIVNKKIEELKQEIKKIKNENLKQISFNSDEEKEKINIEKDLEKLLLKDLKKIAKENKIKGRSKMNKAKLYEVIKENEYHK